MDTSRPAVVEGRIEVVGPSGGAVVPVRAQVVDPTPASDPRPSDDDSSAVEPQLSAPTASPSAPGLSPESKIEPDSTAAISPRRLPAGISIPIVAAWLAVVATILLGLLMSHYSGQNWYEILTHKALSVLGVLTAPIAMLCTTLARTGRARLAWAAVLAGTRAGARA